VAGQYDVVGCIAHGGLGWIYLARDRNVDDVWRVLKGVLQHGDQQAIAAAIEERRFLAAVDHPDIVKIINFVQHDGAGYIVMEYVEGTSLREVVARSGALRPSQALAHVSAILPALRYLHEQGLIYCDLKPDNVMKTARSVKLIDLGAAVRAGDPACAVYATPGFQAPELAQTGPTVASDIFTVGRTLANLCGFTAGFHTTLRFDLPPRRDVAAFAAHDSLYRLIARATAADPASRFESIAELADQLAGVHREVAANESGQPWPAPSTLFTGKLRGRVDGPDWRGLPLPLVDPLDPSAAYLATIVTDDAEALIDALRRAPQQTAAVRLHEVRALLERGQPDDAAPILQSLAVDSPRNWRRLWLEGMQHLAGGRADAASHAFRIVYELLPGELAPKLALGVAAESAGRREEAASWYAIVSNTDPAFTAASLGLARSLATMQRPAEAAAANDRVPESSSAHQFAQTAKARLLVEHATTLDTVAEAARIIDALALAPAARAELSAAVFERALRLTASSTFVAPRWRLLGQEVSQVGLRRGLEGAYRTMARHASTQRDRIALIDKANRVRPRTLI
jgi:serine/threonine-protein kinase PknG